MRAVQSAGSLANLGRSGLVGAVAGGSFTLSPRDAGTVDGAHFQCRQNSWARAARFCATMHASRQYHREEVQHGTNCYLAVRTGLVALPLAIMLAGCRASPPDTPTSARYDRRPEDAKRKAAGLLHVPYRKRGLDVG